MKKTVISVVLMAVTAPVNAVLINGSTLNIAEGSFFTIGDGGAVLNQLNYG